MVQFIKTGKGGKKKRDGYVHNHNKCIEHASYISTPPYIDNQHVWWLNVFRHKLIIVDFTFVPVSCSTTNTLMILVSVLIYCANKQYCLLDKVFSYFKVQHYL